MTTLRLTYTGNQEANGLRIFALDLYDGGKIVETWPVNSGQPHAQSLLRYTETASYSGDMRPIPEGIYRVGGLDFAGGKFDWIGGEPGIGDFWAPITPMAGETKRGAFGFHWDENRAESPGSAGCVVFPTKGEVERFVRAVRKYHPGQLVVDYGLGSVPPAPGAKQPTAAGKPKASSSTAHLTLDGRDLGQVPVMDGQTICTVQALASILGYTTAWDAQSKTVRLSSK